MSRTVDERVVSMQFDNKQFEANVKTSLGTIDRLKQSLNFKGAGDGLKAIASESKKCDMSVLNKGIETVHAKFSALEVMGVTALARITNSAMTAGERLVKAFTLDPIKSGFQEYETQINAVQTILANTSAKGTTLEQVNSALDELNHYADKTIYNFTEMTRNIGTFTAAGIDLDTSVNAIQGIANLAAVSGSTSQQASTAMYQLSQALATGTVKLMDWNSVVNAGMGGQVFQDALKETSRLLGTGADAAIEAQGSFRESLSAGWLTSQVLTETLKKFTTSGANEYVAEYCGISADAVQAALDSAKAQYGEADAVSKASEALAAKTGKNKDEIESVLQMARTAEDAATKVKTFTQLMDTLKEAAQSGWTQSWETIIGDFEEAKDLFTELSNTFGGLIEASANARNAVLEGGLDSPWETLIGKVKLAGLSTDEFQTKVREAAKEHGYDIEQMIKDQGSLANVIKSGSLKESSVFTDALKKMSDGENKVSESTKKMSEDLSYFQNVVDKVWMGDFQNGEERIKALTDAGYDYAGVQELVNKTIDGHKLSMEDLSAEQIKNLACTEKLSDAQLKSIGYSDEQVDAVRKVAKECDKTGVSLDELVEKMGRPSGRWLLVDSFRNALSGIISVCGQFKKAWKEAWFGDASENDIIKQKSERLYEVVNAIHAFSEKLIPTEHTLDNIKNTLKGLFTVVKLVSTVMGGGMKIAVGVLAKLFGLTSTNVLELTGHIGEAISRFGEFIDKHDYLGKAIDFVSTVIFTGIKAIKQWVDSFLELPKVKSQIGLMTHNLQQMGTIMSDVFAKGMSSVEKFGNKVKDLKNLSFEDMIAGIKNFVNQTKTKLTTFEFSFEGVKSAVSSFKESLSTHLKDAGIKLDEFTNKVSEFCQKISDTIGIKFNLGNILVIALSVGYIALLRKFGKFVGSMTDLIGVFKDGVLDLRGVVKSFTGIFKSVSNVMNAFATKIKTESLLNIAKAIAILVGSIALLCYLPQDRLQGALETLGWIASGLLAFTFALNQMKGMGVLSTGNKTILSLVGAVMILVVALKIMDTLDPAKLVTNVITLGAMIMGLAAFVSIMSYYTPVLASGSSTLIAMAGAVMMLSVAMKVLSMIDPKRMGQSLIAITILIGEMTAAMIALSKWGGQVAGAAGALLGMAAALLIMSVVVKILGTMEPETVVKGLFVITLLLEVFAAVIIATKMAGQYAAKAGVMLLGMSAALLIMAGTIFILGTMEPSKVAKGIVAITAMLVVYSLVIAASHLAGENAAKAGAMLLMMSVAILILVGAIAILSLLDPAGLARAVAAIAVLEICFMGLLACTALVQDSLKTITKMTIVIAVLAIAVAALSMIDPVRLASATAALSSLMIMFSVMLVATKYAGKVSGTIFVMAAVVIAIGGILYLLSQHMENAKGALIAASAISLVMITMAVVLAVVAAVGDKANAGLGALAAITGVVLALALIIGYLCGVKGIENALTIATSLSILLIALSVCCGILALVGLGGPAALIGIGSLAVLIVAMGALMIGIGALATYFPKLEEFLDTGLPLLEKIGYGIGSFIGNIVGGFLGGMSSGLVEIADNLSNFMVHLTPFLIGAKMIDPSATEGIKNLAEMLLILTAADLLNSLTSFLTGGVSLSDFADQLVPLGEAMVNFSNSLTGMNPEIVNAAATAGKALAEMAATVPASGGKLQEFFGSHNMGEFGTQLESFGQCLVNFSITVSGLQADAVRTAAEVSKPLVDMANTVPKSGPLVDFLGSHNMAAFGTQLVSFGTSLTQFSASVSSGGAINQDAITKAVTCSTSLVDLANSLPKTGVLISFLGGHNMAQFGSQLVAFGGALVTYSATVSDGSLDPTAIAKSVRAASSLSELAKAMPEDDGGWFSDSTIEAFAKGIKKLGQGLAAYSIEAVNIDSSAISMSTSSARGILNFMKSLDGFEATGIDEFKKGLEQLGTISVTNFVTAFTDASGQISSAVNAMMSTLVTAIMSGQARVTLAFGSLLSGASSAIIGQSASFGNAGHIVMVSFCNGVNSGKGNVTSAFTSMMSIALSAIMSRAGTFGNGGRTLMTAFINGIRSGGVGVVPAINSIIMMGYTYIISRGSMFTSAGHMLMSLFVTGLRTGGMGITSAIIASLSSCESTIRGYHAAFYNAGLYLGEGLTDGIEAKETDAYNAGFKLGQAAVDGEKAGQESQSPSKATKKAGKWLGEGLVIGMSQMAKSVYKSGESMGANAVDSISGALSGVSDIVDSDLDIAPTIRPVVNMDSLDKSNMQITANVSALLNKPIESLSSIMSAAQAEINASNQEVIAAVNGLREDLNALYSADDQEVALYVDSKKLASTLAKPMNKQLSILSRRGV